MRSHKEAQKAHKDLAICAFVLFVRALHLPCSVFMAISLLALDLDGTLLDSRGHISERNRLAIDNAREQGVRVALVTGRRFRDSRPVALELGLDVPLISHNGALTKHAATLADRLGVAVATCSRARGVASRARSRC